MQRICANFYQKLVAMLMLLTSIRKMLFTAYNAKKSGYTLCGHTLKQNNVNKFNRWLGIIRLVLIVRVAMVLRMIVFFFHAFAKLEI